MSIASSIQELKKELPSGVKLVAVSKFHPVEAIEEALAAGQAVFGENRPQEFEKKAQALQDRGVEWHFIGHLQTNKLKMVLPYADLVQSVDSEHLLSAIDDWGKKNGKVIPVLLELHVAAEETKQGFFEEEVLDIMFRVDSYRNVRADFARIKAFYDYLRDLFPEYSEFRELSIGMSGDWRLALDYGATMVRIGTAIFGERKSA